MKRMLARLGWFALALAALPGFAQTAPAVKDVGAVHTLLYVGNSFFYYNNSLHNHVGRLLAAADPQGRSSYRATSATISGSGLNWHDMEAYFKPGGMASYSFAPGNKVVFNKFDKPFDAVVMMDCSQCPIHPQLKDLFYEYTRKDADIARSHGARPILFMSWAYADRPEMTSQLADAYTAAGNAAGALVVPAGLAFAKARERLPELNLYAEDKRHPSPAGTYLAACTVLAAVYGRSPVGNSYRAGLDPQTAAQLQRAAADTVREYLGRDL